MILKQVTKVIIKDAKGKFIMFQQYRDSSCRKYTRLSHITWPRKWEKHTYQDTSTVHYWYLEYGIICHIIPGEITSNLSNKTTVIFRADVCTT